jgi:hypothetical protein
VPPTQIFSQLCLDFHVAQPPSPAFLSSDRSFFFLTRAALLSPCTRRAHSSARSFPWTLLSAEVSPSSPGRCAAPLASSPSFCPLTMLFLKSCQPTSPPPGGAELLPLAWIRPSFYGSWPRPSSPAFVPMASSWPLLEFHLAAPWLAPSACRAPLVKLVPMAPRASFPSRACSSSSARSWELPYACPVPRSRHPRSAQSPSSDFAWSPAVPRARPSPCCCVGRSFLLARPTMVAAQVS